jgi:hypothetical protein
LGGGHFHIATLENEKIITPVIQAFLKENILLVGFKILFKDALGNPNKNDFGFLLTFKEDVIDLNFKGSADNQLENAAKVADVLKNRSTKYGKHISLFI